MSKELFVHIGFPKTATTTLQDNVFCNHSDVNFFGKPFDQSGKKSDFVNKQVEVVHKLWNQEEKDFQYQRLFDIGQKFYFPYLDEKRKNVISLEELSYATPRRVFVAGRIHKVFGPSKIIMTLRSQPDAIISAYFWKYMNLEINEPFDIWFHKMEAMLEAENLFPDNYTTMRLFNYAEVVGMYERVFGKENICILLFEWLKYDPGRFVNHLSTFMGIDPDETARLLALKHKNYRMSLAAIHYQRNIKNMHIAFASRVLRNSRMTQINFYNGVFRWGANGLISDLLNRCSAKPSHTWSENQRAALHKYYGQGNSMLHDRYGLDLERYGYPM